MLLFDTVSYTVGFKVGPLCLPLMWDLGEAFPVLIYQLVPYLRYPTFQRETFPWFYHPPPNFLLFHPIFGGCFFTEAGSPISQSIHSTDLFVIQSNADEAPCDESMIWFSQAYQTQLVKNNQIFFSIYPNSFRID